MGHLITPEFEELFVNHTRYSQIDTTDPLVIAKLYDQFSPAVWFLTEYNSHFKVAFGYITGIHTGRFGYVSIEKLEKIKFSIIDTFKIKQDWSFSKKPLSEALRIHREKKR
jgi:hypothetical protein